MPLLENLESQGNYLFRKRGMMPLIIVAPGLPIAYYTKLDHYQIIPTTWFKSFELICLLICLLGLFIRIITVGYAPSGTSGRNIDKQIADKLNQTGMYSIVRHPLYLGNFFMWFGICLLTFNFWFTSLIVLVYWIYYERIMFSEEQFLRKKYGADYLEWASRTPTFIPRFKNWKSPDRAFSLKKVIRQEKNALLAIFLSFFVIGIISEGKNIRRFFAEEWYWTLGLMVSLLLYGVLKFLKYKTKVLSDVPAHERQRA